MHDDVTALWSGLSAQSRRLTALGAGLLLLMVVAVTLTMLDLRRVALQDARRGVAGLGIAVAEQTTRAIQAADLALQDDGKDIVARGIDTPDRFIALMQTQQVQAGLRQQLAQLPQLDAVTVIDRNGRLVNSSRRWPIVALDLSDRDYYRHFRDADDPKAFVSNPVRSRGDGRWTFYVVRRVDGPGGTFLGLVVGAIKIDYFRDFYKALTRGGDFAVTLLRSDGTMLASYPEVSRVGQHIPAGEPWYGIVARGHPDTLIVKGILQSGRRVAAINPLTDYSLVVNVGVWERRALANFRRAALLVALGTVSAVLCVALLLRALVLQLRRLESSEASLGLRNRELEATQMQLKAQAQELEASRTRLVDKSAALATTLDRMHQGILMIDDGGMVAVCNSRCLQMLGLPVSLLDTRLSYLQLIALQIAGGDPLDGVPQWLATGMVPDRAVTYERQLPDDRILEVTSEPLPGGGMVRTFTDITERRRSEAQVRYFAEHDDLTKLVNRVVFRDRLERAIALAGQAARSAAVFYLDLDRFKVVNDSKGHAAGDRLLAQVAERLRDAVRDTDTVARMGGDEFAIIQPLIEHHDRAYRLAERVLHLMRQPFDLDGTHTCIGVSIGLAYYPDHATDAGDLLRKADVALYHAKAAGRGTVQVFQPFMEARQQQLLFMEQELAQALELKQLALDYQPIVETATGRITGFEALLRWHHPRRGLVPPNDFIGVAESSGLIIPIGLWVLETACTLAVTWPDDIAIAVNLSPAQFDDHALAQELADILRRTGLPPARLILEVTEGMLLQDTGMTLDIMAQLREAGVRFSLDDFGTGHAGLSTLRRFAFDALKIDRFFVADMVEQPAARAIVAAMIGISRSLDLGVVAEGVETVAQLEMLRQLGCARVQGMLTGRPQSAEAASASLMAAADDRLIN